jgi:molybdopterin converting factor subunit 1
MRIQVKLFAQARQLVGRETVEVELPARTTVAVLRREIAAQYPALENLAPHTLVALDKQYADDGDLVPSEAEVAFLPPVSGG